MRKITKRILTAALLFSAAVFISTLIPISKDTIMGKLGFPYEIYDRNGKLLRKGISSRGFYYSYINLKKIPDHVIKALIAIEDKNFHFHGGVSFRALIAAVYRNIAGKKRSGGSTITMQVARNIYSLPRTIPSKMYEIWMAWRLENSFSKKELLELYFNTIPFGKQIIGIKMAARIYFDKEPAQLSPAQGAFLIALVKFPSYITRKRYSNIVTQRQKYVLKEMYQQKVLDLPAYKRALSEKITVRKMDYATVAPHYCNFLLSKLKKIYKGDLKKVAKIYTTLDYEIQKKAFRYAAEAVRKLRKKKISNAAVVVIDNKTGELLAMVGSVDFANKRDSGQINGAVAIRPPGSTLKPFTYGTAFEKAILTPATVIPDIRTYIRSKTGDFIPINYNRIYNGPIPARKALACSYNVSAARVISQVTVEEVLRILKKCNFKSLSASAAYYGTSLTLGGADVTLLELAGGYLMLANQGMYIPTRFIKEIIDINGKKIKLPAPQKAQQVFSQETAFLLSSILSDNDARADSFSKYSPLNFPFFCAAKTGTSVGFRNNWTAGFSKNITAAVWVGNFDNTPMHGVSGITGAGTIFRNIILSSEQDQTYKLAQPNGIVSRVVCPKSGLLAKKSCNEAITEFFMKGTEPQKKCSVHFSIPYHEGTEKIAYIHKSQKKRFSHIEWKKTTILPPIYNQWLKNNGYPLPSIETKKYLTWISGNKKTGVISPKIVYPDNGDIFIVDPILERSAQAIIFRGLFPNETRQVIWQLNDTKIRTKRYPFSYRWQIKRGTYSLRAIAITSKGKIITEKVSFKIN